MTSSNNFGDEHGRVKVHSKSTIFGGHRGTKQSKFASFIKEAGHKGGTVLIEAKEIESAYVEVSLADTGPGFPAALLADPFPPFSSTKAEGLGVGLSLSRSIVEAHGGRLSVAGGAQGAVVVLTLPVAPNNA